MMEGEPGARPQSLASKASKGASGLGGTWLQGEEGLTELLALDVPAGFDLQMSCELKTNLDWKGSCEEGLAADRLLRG